MLFGYRFPERIPIGLEPSIQQTREHCICYGLPQFYLKKRAAL